MNAKPLLSAMPRRRRHAVVLIAACLAAAVGRSAPTELATEPFALSATIKALPNIMFVLDDSGSMNMNYLPDWAGPYQQTISGVLTTVTPAYRFFNAAFNGIAYNPSTRYRPPVMYAADGSIDTTTYPSMTGASTATGGDASASAGSPNWHAVKLDGYGVQSVATYDLQAQAGYYTTIPGEYCTSVNLRSCTASATPTGSYTYPARLRWCTTAAAALATTAVAGTSCQATNIEPASGITDYTYPRMPRPPFSTLTVTAPGTVTGITVSGSQILSASASGGTSSDTATDIAAKINACTYGVTGSCAVNGYAATALADTVIIAAPGATAVTPVVTGGSTTVTAFSVTSVPGSTVFTVITSTVNSYPYPGTAAKASTRTDCAGTTCTYAEEMTNYANWFSYYRTRMQMMKTAASIAFSSIDENFRVGYFSINNGSGNIASNNAFLNVDAFDGTQRNAWYSKFFAAVPYGPTPLRTGLSTAGRFYAGLLSTINGETATDPMQYSCQQNFTILSTDGYWNDASTPKQLDGIAEIGQQDGNVDRPYYDGATQTRTVTQTTRADLQVGMNEFVVEQLVQQQQAKIDRVTQTVTETVRYPYTERLTQLQTQTTPLIKSENRLESRTYPLKVDTRELQQSEYKLNSTPRILQSYTYNLTRTSTPLDQRVYKVTESTRKLTARTYNVTRAERLLTATTTKVTRGTQMITERVYKVKSNTQQLTRRVYNLTTNTYQLRESTYKLRQSERHLQKRQEESSDGGDTWQDTGWVDVATCDTTATIASQVRNIQCRYGTATDTGGLNSCTTINQDATNPYTVPVARSCAYETTPTVADVGTCTVRAQDGASPYQPSVACGYAASATTLTGQLTCTAKDETGFATMTGNKVTCAYDTTPTTTTNLDSCTWIVPSPAASSPKTDCAYQTAVTANNLNACTADAAETATTNNSEWRTAVACSYEASAATTTPNLSSCTWIVPSPIASSPKTECSYQAAGYASGLDTCSAHAADTATTHNSSWSTAVSCAYDSSATSTLTNQTVCTWAVPSPAASAPKTECAYQSATNYTNQANCTVDTAETATTHNSEWRTAVACSYDASPATTLTDQNTCTWIVPSPAASVPRTDCAYQTATNLTGQNSCTVDTAETATTHNSEWRTAVACAYDTTPTTTSGVDHCTWVVPSPAASAPRTDCAYNAGAATTTTNLGSCTADPPETATANNSVWDGPAVTCNYQAAVVASNLTTCTAGSPSPGPINYNSYITCGYINGTTTTGLNSCSYVADSTANPYAGPANACAYATTPVTTTETACTTRAQSGTFAHTQIACAYAAATTATNQATCTEIPMSGGSPYAGPAKHCYYDTTASATNLNAATCTANRQTASPYTGPAVDCNYNATAVVTNNVSTCTEKAQDAGPSFTGPAVDCDYGTPSGWTPVLSGSCTVATASGSSPYAGPVRECDYNGAQVNNNAGNSCTPAESTAPNYTILQRRQCIVDPHDVAGTPLVSTVDACTAGTTAPVDEGDGIFSRTTTACAMENNAWANALTCSVIVGGEGPPNSFAKNVDCRMDPAVPLWIPVEPTCTARHDSGSTAVPDPTTGLLVQCRLNPVGQIGTNTTSLTQTSANTWTFAVTSLSDSVKVASCTPSTDSTTKRQTRCTTLLATGPDPVETCTPADPPQAPDFVKTTCNTTTTTSTVMGCSAQTATSPLWQTITCAADGTGTSNTLADVAIYYWSSDLRTPALGNCTGATVPPAASGNTLCTATDPMNNVPTTVLDSNAAQHMTTFTLGLGASGYMRYSPTYDSDTSGDFPTVKGVAPYKPANGITADPANGICPWQPNGLCNWPYPVADEQTTIDDLWHAGVNGRGAYFSATDPTTLANSLTSTLAQVAAQSAVSAAAALSNPVLTPGDSYVFSGTYTTVEWSGDVRRTTLDPFSGLPNSTFDWSASTKLDAKAYTTRSIHVFDGSTATKLKPFNTANFGTSNYFNLPHVSTLTQFQCNYADICLTPTDQDNAHGSGNNLVNYVRGDRANEGIETDNTKYYRARTHVLGDIVNAQIVYVTTPARFYADKGYDAFKTAQASRPAVAYAAANDGMLHAFRATGTTATEDLVKAAANAYVAAVLDPTNATKATAAATAQAAANAALAGDTEIGQEMWAYIPTPVIPHLYKLADKKYKDKHRYFVDSTPVVGDICVSNCDNAATAVWKTILVGGLGRGGRGYYALDVTDPTAPKALWEFTDTNLGYTYGTPQIAKKADGTWVVVFGSGYNNIANDDGAGGDGVGRLYVLNAATGAHITGVSPLSTGVGSATTPSGLSEVTAAVVNPSTDATIVAIYGGDLLGNLWRFDINNNVGATGVDAQLLAALKDGSGNSQPITTSPVVSLVQKKYVIFVGTGQFLASSDSLVTSQQSVYGIVDHREDGTTPATAIYDNPGGEPRLASAGVNTNGFVMQTFAATSCPAGAPTYICVSGQTVITSSNVAVDYQSHNGWFVDLINPSERANLDMQLALGALVFNTNAPSSSACDLGGKTYQYWLDYKTGAAIQAPGYPAIAGMKLSDSLLQMSNLFETDSQLRSGTQKCIGANCYSSTPVPQTAEASITRRTAWRELVIE